MQSQSPLLDGVARAMNGAMGMAQGMREEAQSFLRAQADRVIADMDLVGREEFEAVKQLALDALAQCEVLRARIEALEGRTAQ